MHNKKGIIFGIANKRSISYGIATALAKEGANLAITYQGEAFKPRVQAIGEELDADIICSADVLEPASLDKVFDEIKEKWGKLDFLIHGIAYSNKEELNGRFVDTSAENFSNSLMISCYSLIDLARRAEPLMKDGGSIITLTFQGSQTVVPFYNAMGVAKAALESAMRYLANDLGEKGIRVNAISPGPMKTLSGSAIGGARNTFRYIEENAPLLSNATLEAIGGTAAFLTSDASACITGDIIYVDGGYHIMGMPRTDKQ